MVCLGILKRKLIVHKSENLKKTIIIKNIKEQNFKKKIKFYSFLGNKCNGVGSIVSAPKINTFCRSVRLARLIKQTQSV